MRRSRGLRVGVRTGPVRLRGSTPGGAVGSSEAIGPAKTLVSRYVELGSRSSTSTGGALAGEVW